MIVRLSDEARTELDEAAGYYDLEKPGLAADFILAFEKGYEHIKSYPKAGKIYEKIFRCQLLEKFPYSIYYTVKSNETSILAIAYQSRKPGYWRKR